MHTFIIYIIHSKTYYESLAVKNRKFCYSEIKNNPLVTSTQGNSVIILIISPTSFNTHVPSRVFTQYVHKLTEVI